MPAKAEITRAVLANLGHYGQPEQEFAIPWAAATTLRSPSSLRTDKLISFLVFRWAGRITSVNAHATLPDAVRNLIQQVRVLGTHAVYGAQTPIRMHGKLFSDLNRIYRVSYAPADVGALPNPTVKAATYDLQVVWTLPVFPLPIPMNLAPLYSLKGPDWAGNLFVEIDTGDETALGGAAGDDTFTAFGSAAGAPTLFVSVVRPSVTVDLMNRISPAICFRTEQNYDNVAQGATFANQLIANLNIGKKMAAIELQTGTLFAPVTAGVRALATYIDTVVTRAYVALDGKGLTVPYSGIEEKEFDDWLGGLPLPAGYRVLSFIKQSGSPDAAFPAETLTAARRFEIDGDVTGAATQSLTVVQEEILGTPQLIG